MIKTYEYDGNLERFLMNIGLYTKKINDKTYELFDKLNNKIYLISIQKENLFENNKEWTSFYVKDKIERKKIIDLIEKNIYNKSNILIFLFDSILIRVD